MLFHALHLASPEWHSAHESHINIQLTEYGFTSASPGSLFFCFFAALRSKKCEHVQVYPDHTAIYFSGPTTGWCASFRQAMGQLTVCSVVQERGSMVLGRPKSMDFLCFFGLFYWVKGPFEGCFLTPRAFNPCGVSGHDMIHLQTHGVHQTQPKLLGPFLNLKVSLSKGKLQFRLSVFKRLYPTSAECLS